MGQAPCWHPAHAGWECEVASTRQPYWGVGVGPHAPLRRAEVDEEDLPGTRERNLWPSRPCELRHAVPLCSHHDPLIPEDRRGLLHEVGDGEETPHLPPHLAAPPGKEHL